MCVKGDGEIENERKETSREDKIREMKEHEGRAGVEVAGRGEREREEEAATAEGIRQGDECEKSALKRRIRRKQRAFTRRLKVD